MIATQNKQAPNTTPSIGVTSNAHNTAKTRHEIALNSSALAIPHQLFLPGRTVTHHPKAGINPLADAAAYLFSVLGKLKQLSSYQQLNKLQKELIDEINVFQEALKNFGYNAEYIVVCRYTLCATFDDILANTAWGTQSQWDHFSLLAAFNQDIHHQEKFFSILDRAIKEPALYIDLMEFMFLCLTMGYKGQYRATEHSQYQLDQITNTLYKHIRAFRGSFSKMLSPPIKTAKTKSTNRAHKSNSPLFILIITACVIMAIFVSLGYLMDVISNEAYQNIAQIKSSVSHETVE